jgi:hypothetical protein
MVLDPPGYNAHADVELRIDHADMLREEFLSESLLEKRSGW